MPKPVIFYGAGDDAKKSGQLLLKYNPVCFVDRDKSKYSAAFMGRRVMALENALLEYPDAIFLITTSRFKYDVYYELLNHVEQSRIMNCEPASRGFIDTIGSPLYTDFNWETYPREAALPEGGFLHISGWIINVIDKSTYNTVKVIIDDEVYEAAKQKAYSIANEFGAQYLPSGFSLSIPMPFMDDGQRHTIKIIGVTVDGQHHPMPDIVRFTVHDRNSTRFSKAKKLIEKFILHPDDQILHVNMLQHPNRVESAIAQYLSSGEACANRLRELCEEVFYDKRPLSLLEFAGGFGRMTRWLDNRHFDITSCDINHQAVQFIKENFLAKTILSKSNPDEFIISETFDIVFCCSFFSHIPDETFGKWIKVLYSLVKSGGILVFTTHGRASNMKHFGLLTDENGYAFEPVSEQPMLPVNEYGRTVTEYSYVANVCERFINVKPTEYKQGFWGSSEQDTYIIRKE